MKNDIQKAVTNLQERILEILEGEIQDIIDDINGEEVFMMKHITVVPPEEEEDPQFAKENPLCLISSYIMEYDSEKTKVRFIDPLDDYQLSYFLIKRIKEAANSHREVEISYIVKGVINFLIETQTAIESFFKIGGMEKESDEP